MKIKIKAADSKYSILDGRWSAMASEHDGIIKKVSCTMEQPWIAVNFSAEGKAIGGRTMTQCEVDRLLSVAAERGMKIIKEESNG